MEPIDNFVEEIKEELRKDQALKFWQQWGNTLIGVALFLIIGTAGNIWYQSHSTAKVEEQTRMYEDVLLALEQNNTEKAKTILRDLSKKGSDGYEVLSELDLANLTSSNDEKAAALLSLSKNTHVPELYQQIATYRYFEHIFQGTAPAEFLKELKEHLKVTHPLYISLKELEGLALLKAKDLKAAAKVFEEIAKDEKAPQGIRLRAFALLDQMVR